MRELFVDAFCGGGGASEGARQALGRSPDIALNHDEDAIGMHQANHPETLHVQNNIYRVDPRDYIRRGQRVGGAWFSPDCRHFSKAKGAVPVARNIRDLCWTIPHWINRLEDDAPRVIYMENVEEFRTYGPLIEIDGKMFPDPEHKGKLFNRWLRSIRARGYKVELEELRCCDYGVPTLRKRLFIIMRRDGGRIEWPAATHGAPTDPEVIAGRKLPWETVASSGLIDWSLPCPSIFLSREEGRALGVNRPLADKTMARIARGVFRFVIDNADPFIVPVTHAGDHRVHSIHDPLRTQTTAHRGEHALVTPYLVHTAHGERDASGKKRGRGEIDLHEPLGAVTASNNHAVVAAFLAQHNTGATGHDLREPASTFTHRGTQQALTVAHLMNMKGTDGPRGGWDMRRPMPAICAGGQHVAEVRAFLVKYYETATGQSLNEPMHTVTTKDRMGLVMVRGEPFQIVDIGMRMLTPRERFRAHGFADDYIIDRRADGTPITRTAQGEKVGNSVPPEMARLLISLNNPEMCQLEKVAA